MNFTALRHFISNANKSPSVLIPYRFKVWEIDKDFVIPFRYGWQLFPGFSNRRQVTFITPSIDGLRRGMSTTITIRNNFRIIVLKIPCWSFLSLLVRAR